MAKISSIGIIAPAAAIKEGEEDRFHQGIKFLEDLGLKVKTATNVFAREELFPGAGTFLPGKSEERIAAMMQLWSDSSVDALLAMRGGYGCIQLLDKLDYSYISRNPKPVLGYSDLTALFAALYTQAYKQKLELFHTPMLLELTNLDQESKLSFLNMLQAIDPLAYKSYKFKLSKQKILGGNLSLIASLVGTKYLPKFKNAILFLEDCKDEAYKIERMFYQLAYAGILSQIKELHLGIPLETEYNYQLIEGFAVKYKFKLVKNLAIGHGATKLSIALG